ncbi:MAG TPA: hypothetical protein VFG50_01035 [Rhodothermales bacterium]|nr:hypothetical protein [Rhodothermales bacterium]
MVLKKVSALSMFLVAILALSAPSAFSQVVDSTETDSLGEAFGAPMIPVNDQAPGQSIDRVNYANVLAAVNGTDAAIAKLSALTDLTADRVHVISVESLAPSTGNTADLDQAIADAAAQRSQLQDTIDDTDALEEALDTSNVDHDAVIGLDVLQDGNVVVFYH